MTKMGERVWGALFAVSIGVLMLTILLMRSDPVPFWVLVVYPVAGGLLGLIASRTSPTAEQMAAIESATIAAAVLIVLAGLVNLLLIDMLLREMRSGEMLGGEPMRQVTFFTAPAAAALFWWALQRRLSQARLAGAQRRRTIARGIPAE